MINIITFVTVCFIGFVLYKIHDSYKNYTILSKHQMYISLFKYYCDIGYELVYKDQVVAFTSSGMSPSNELLDTIKRNYVKITLQLMGKSVRSTLLDFYFDSDTLIENMIFYFQQKLDTDDLVEFAKKVRQQDSLPDKSEDEK